MRSLESRYRSLGSSRRSHPPAEDEQVGVTDARSGRSHRQDNSGTALLTPPVAAGAIVGFMRANNNTQRALAALSAIAVAVEVVISPAPTAHADEQDDAF